MLALCSLFIMTVSCSKKNKEEPPLIVNQEIKAIQEYLSQTDSVKVFGNSFQKVTITDADASLGLTVFAPVNSAITAYDPNARVMVTELSETEVKDHIVKGVIKRADLTNGKKLKSLSGKELIIVIEGDRIMINGVSIMTVKEDTSKHVIYTIANVLNKKPGIAEITVLDGTLWSTIDTLGKPVADAEVTLYYTRTDYKNKQPAFTAKTDGTGKVTFTGLAAGTYYLVAKKDDKYNYFEPGYLLDTQVAYKATGIYQTTAQINSSPHLTGAVPGDFIFAELNVDGKLDANDKSIIPFEITVRSNKTIQVKSLIGYTFNHFGAPFASKADAQQFLDNLYVQIGNWHQQQTVMDGVLSDDADCTNLPTWCTIDNFTFNASTTNIVSLWQLGYDYITMLNRLIVNVPLLNLTLAESNMLIAQAKGLRGFIFLELATYYGELPLQDKIMGDYLSRSSLSDTYQFIKNDLTDAMSILPTRWTAPDHRRIGAHACKLLLARIALVQTDYAKAKQFTNELIQSGTYQLVNASNIFVSDVNAEIIWNIGATILSQYSAYFAGSVTRNFNPAARYSEVLLINTEAKIQLAELDATALNLLKARRSQPSVTFTNKTNAMQFLSTVWQSEQYREGQRFAKLLNWGLAANILYFKGYKLFNNVLPIPEYLLYKNANIQQNPGY